MLKFNIEMIKEKILESSVTRENIFALLESVENNNKTIAFHVTFSKNIKGILGQGLSKRKNSNFYKIENSNRGVFFSTCEEDISYWFSKFEELAANTSDDYVKSGLVPVVLKFDVQGQFEIDKIARDEDHRFCSYYSDVTIPGNQISFYYNGWQNLNEFKNEMILNSVDEDGYFLRNSQNPFYPSNNILTETSQETQAQNINLPDDQYHDLEDELGRNMEKTPEKIIEGWKNVDDNYYGIEEDVIRTSCCGDFNKIKYENKWYIRFDRDLTTIEGIIDNYERYLKYFPFISNMEDMFNSDFWNSPATLYHATDCDNVEDILSEGLKGGSGTGLSNRYVSGVFTSLEPEGYIDSYGDCVIAIDCHAMAVDGLTPYVAQEPDVVERDIKEALRDLLEYEGEYEYESSTDTDPNTIIISKNIPPKYLKLFKGSLTEAITIKIIENEED